MRSADRYQVQGGRVARLDWALKWAGCYNVGPINCRDITGQLSINFKSSPLEVEWSALMRRFRQCSEMWSRERIPSKVSSLHTSTGVSSRFHRLQGSSIRDRDFEIYVEVVEEGSCLSLSSVRIRHHDQRRPPQDLPLRAKIAL